MPNEREWEAQQRYEAALDGFRTTAKLMFAYMKTLMEEGFTRAEAFAEAQRMVASYTTPEAIKNAPPPKPDAES